MALTLRYNAQSSIPVEIEGFTPDRVRDKSLAEIERVEIFHGNEKLPLAELFTVSGDASDEHFEFEGDLSGVHWIGAHMTSGTLRVQGNVGRHLGSEMHGGTIHVTGSASDWVGGEMHGGLIHITGEAGHLVGAAYRGSARGMTGGTILVQGSAGNEVGHSMRRGLVAIGGVAGDLLGFNMIAGTVLVFGRCGLRPGAEMRRGTIGLLGGEVPRLLPTFRHACRYRPQMIPLVLRYLRSLDFSFDDNLLAADYDLYHGDFLALGKGELLIKHPAA